MANEQKSSGLPYLIYISLVVALIFLYPLYKPQVRTLLLTAIPCTFPVTYSLGTLDPRFDVSKEQFIKDIGEASSLWGKAIGKELFKFEASGADISVNLVYDTRQQSTEKLGEVGSQLDIGKREYARLKAIYESLANQVDLDKQNLEKSINEYYAESKAYNQSVQYWNDKGGAPEEEYKKLQVEKSALQNKEVSISQKQADIKVEVAQTNAAVEELNAAITKYNINVRQYNTVGSTLGEQFNEGEYVQKAFTREINIYQYGTQAELVRVLTHEFGHALGLAHINSNPDAIMYYLNQSKNGALTKDDVAALKNICRIK